MVWGRVTWAVVFYAMILLSIRSAGFAEEASEWLDAMREEARKIRSVPENERAGRAVQAWNTLERRFPLPSDWMLQDSPDEPLSMASPAGGSSGYVRPQQELIGDTLVQLLTEHDTSRWLAMTDRVLTELGPEANHLADERRELSRRGSAATELELAQLYLQACRLRRQHRLEPLLKQDWEGIVFARHFNMGGSFYGYTEALSDARRERNFLRGSELLLLRLDDDGTPVVETLLEDGDGVIRDVDVSWDGTEILFSWKKSDRGDDYSLYIMDVETREVRAVTEGLGHADYEGVFLPNGDIVFSSTRNVQIVDCFWTEVSNLYTVSADGRFMRRLGFDQVHTNYPTVTADGRVLYTRWDYNDRTQVFIHGLFQMNPDGTSQMEYYGNSSWFPTSILHARHIPGTQKTLAVFTGHHTFQAGKLGVLDPNRGRQENQGAQLVAPVRETPAERIDKYGQCGDLFMYPYPVDEQHFLVSYSPRGYEGRNRRRYSTVFGLYFMDMDGRRELLDRDTERNYRNPSTGRMVPLVSREPPHERPSMVDYRKDTGTYYVENVYEGVGLEGVERGTIKWLRVVGLEYRVAGIGAHRQSGAGGHTAVITPIGTQNASWDVKEIFGRAKVHEDGSALFEAPARTPLYFQALDEHGQAVQSMRSWSTLQPGEFLSCIGCHHTHKQEAPRPGAGTSRAMQAGIQELEPYYGPPEGFSYDQRIQPILDRHCVDCHSEGEQVDGAPFSLADTVQVDGGAQRKWTASYLRLTDGGPDRGPVRWIDAMSGPPMLPPYTAGAAVSPMMEMLHEGHHDVQLSEREMGMLAAWIDLAVPFCGDYAEANTWNDSDKQMYNHFLEKRRDMETLEADNIADFIRERQGVPDARPSREADRGRIVK